MLYEFNSTSNDPWRDRIDTDYMMSKYIYTQIDWATEIDYAKSMIVWEGFFKAPTDGRYRFLMSCDDRCRFAMSVDDPLNPDTAEQLMFSGASTSYRNTDIEDKSETSDLYENRFSNWVTLAKDEHYYVEAYVIN